MTPDLGNLASSQRVWWWIVTGIGLCVAGCGDNQDGPGARLDDTALPCTPTTRVFRIDHVDPSARVAAELDLDGDGAPNDALGHGADLLATLAPGFAIVPRFDARLTSDVPWLVAIDQCEGAPEARVTIERGVVLGAGATPELPRVLPRAVGALEAGELTASDGQARLPLIALADAARTHLDQGWRVGDALTVHATLDGTTLRGVFAFALPTDVVRADLASPIADFLGHRPAGDDMRTATDLDHDGTVTAAELAATVTFQSITASDLQLGDAPQTSVAFRFTATELRR